MQPVGPPGVGDDGHSWLDRELGLTFWWDVRKLWSVDLPTVEVPVAELEWLLDLPFWDDGVHELALAPSTVAARPGEHLQEYRRTMTADLRCPINVIQLDDRLIVMDGVHRLLKAWLLGHHSITTKVAQPVDIPTFAREAWEPSNHP